MPRLVPSLCLTTSLAASLALGGCASKAAAPPPATPTAATDNGMTPGKRALMRRAHTKVTEKAIEIDEKVQFEVGKATILPASDELLKEVADDLREHAEILELQIEGHASIDGGIQLNRELSQKRADAVKQWLVDQGVEAARLVAKGYGPDRPIAPNDSEDGREKNRRVEFNISKHK